MQVFYACDSGVPSSAVKIVRFRRVLFFKIILHQISRNSAMVLNYIFLIDNPWRASAKMANSVIEVVMNRFTAFPMPISFDRFFSFEEFDKVAALS